MRLVKAKEMGFHNGSRVRPGTTFTVSDTFQAKWVEEVEPASPPVVEQVEPASPPVAEQAEPALPLAKKKAARKAEDPASPPDFDVDLA